MTRSISIQIPNRAAAIETLMCQVSAFCRRHQLPLHLVPQLGVVFDEIVSNIVHYAYPAEGEQVITIDLALAGGELQVEIGDDGKPFDPTQAPDIGMMLDIEERPIGGLGLLLVRKLTDHVHYERRGGRNILQFAKSIIVE